VATPVANAVRHPTGQEVELAEALLHRWRAIRLPLLIASAGIVVGGVVAACSRPLGLTRGSWLAAFLVLVAGVAQIALNVGQVWLAEVLPSPASVRAQTIAWNGGVAATIVGNLTALIFVTAVGGFGIVVALALFLAAVHEGSGAPRWVRLSYVTLAATVLLSTPVGIVLAWH
jgi:hypothetical protein